MYVNTMCAYMICAYIHVICDVREERGERGERDSPHLPASDPYLPGGQKRKKQGKKEPLTGGKTSTKNEVFHPSGTEIKKGTFSLVKN